MESSDNLIHNASMGIHFVDADGNIIYANQSELEILGYHRDEYVGHHSSEFQMDKNVFEDMMERLSRREILKNYPARVQGKNGVKYILYNSSVYEENGKFIHTRCFATDIDEIIYRAFVAESHYFS